MSDVPKRLFDFLEIQQRSFPLEVMFTSKKDNVWVAHSTAEVVQQVHLASRGLIAEGVKPGDKVGLITHANMSEWNIMDLAILQVGAVDVPIYPTMTVDDYVYILNHAEVEICFVSNADLFAKLSSAKDRIPQLRKIYTFDVVPGAITWNALFQRGASVPESTVHERKRAVLENDLATIIYTSGTTGLPKGVMLSHKNITSNVINCQDRLPYLTPGKSRTLSFLPCCHSFERMLHYLYMLNGVSMYLTGMDTIKEDLLVARPHIFTGVPRLFEKFFDGIHAKGIANTGIKKKLFVWAQDLAMEWKPDNGNGTWYALKLSIARALVFSKVKRALGLTEIRAVASGSAALQPRLARFFCGAGIPLKEGYGLTETSPVISVNTLRHPHMWRAGSVGMPIQDEEVKIAEDGEILCKGPNVMIGYYKEPEMTAEVLKDGWFHTGDIGELRDGFLYITDRKKEIFKTSGGKYIAPQVVENALKESPFIEQAMVVGEAESFPAALIVPDYVIVQQWGKEEKLPEVSNEEWSKNPALIARLQSEVDRINEKFGSWEQVKTFRLLPKPFSIENGELTPTLKLKRKVVMSNYKALVEDIYHHGEDRSE